MNKTNTADVTKVFKFGKLWVIYWSPPCFSKCAILPDPNTTVSFSFLGHFLLFRWVNNETK